MASSEVLSLFSLSCEVQVVLHVPLPSSHAQTRKYAESHGGCVTEPILTFISANT